MPNKRHANNRWVVTSCAPSPVGDPRACYTDSGASSQIRSQWAQFFTRHDAKFWTEKNEIEVDGITCCIIETMLSDFDISLNDSKK